jgi:hypothetical protein
MRGREGQALTGIVEVEQSGLRMSDGEDEVHRNVYANVRT